MESEACKMDIIKCWQVEKCEKNEIEGKLEDIKKKLHLTIREPDRIRKDKMHN